MVYALVSTLFPNFGVVKKDKKRNAFCRYFSTPYDSMGKWNSGLWYYYDFDVHTF